MNGYDKTFGRECKICPLDRCIREVEYIECTTDEEIRQDREDAYIMGLKWAINAAIMFNTHGMRFYSDRDEERCMPEGWEEGDPCDPWCNGKCGIDEESGEPIIEDHEEWSDAAQIIVDNFEKKMVPHWIFEVKNYTINTVHSVYLSLFNLLVPKFDPHLKF